MDSLIQAIKERIEKSAKEGGSESIGQIIEDFISKGYKENEVEESFRIVFKTYESNEYN